MPIRTILVFCCFTFYSYSQSTRIDQAKKLYESKKYTEAIKLLESVEEEDKSFAEARFYLGRVAFDQKEYDDAADFFEEATEANDNVAEYFDWLGNTYGTIAQDANVLKQGMLAPKMRNAWEKAITLDPEDIPARISLIQYYTQAPGFMGGSIDKAKEIANQILKLNPAQGHFQLGNIYVSQKKITEAENEFIQMVRIDPVYTTNLANFYVGQKQFDKAFELFEVALKKNPDDFAAIYQLGKTSALSGQRLDRGEDCLKRYLTYTPRQNEPSHAGANMRLAQISEKRGNKTEAKKLYEVALKLDAGLKEAKEGLQRTSK